MPPPLPSRRLRRFDSVEFSRLRFSDFLALSLASAASSLCCARTNWWFAWSRSSRTAFHSLFNFAFLVSRLSMLFAMSRMLASFGIARLGCKLCVLVRCFRNVDSRTVL